MTDITRAVTSSDLGDLLATASVAVVAWNDGGQIAAEPVAFRFADGRYLLGVPPQRLKEHSEVAVLVDDGVSYFELRGVRVRGRLARAAQTRDDGLEWFEVIREHEVAWHYGRMRAT
jgi:hypothetical protein